MNAQAVREELASAALSATAEIEKVEGRQAIRKPDGSLFFLDTLSSDAYWCYMSAREHAWYEPPNPGYQG